MQVIDRIAPSLAVAGGLNWALVGLANVDLVAKVFGERHDADTRRLCPHRDRDPLLPHAGAHVLTGTRCAKPALVPQRSRALGAVPRLRRRFTGNLLSPHEIAERREPEHALEEAHLRIEDGR